MADTDRREAILARLEEVIGAIEGIAAVFRNRIDIPETKRPAGVILDADEMADETGEGRGRPPITPILAIMTPEIYLLLSGKAEDIGTTINAFRIRLIKAVLTDQTLIGFCKDGDIRYLGFATGLASGRSMEGEAGISFQFRYVVYPSKL